MAILVNGSNEKIKKHTNWKPNYTFEQGIAETVEFFKGNLDKYKTDIYNIQFGGEIYEIL